MNLESLVQDYFSGLDYQIIDLVLRGEGGTKVLEIFADSRDGVNIDELARINRELNKLVDDNLMINDISKLIVSSPGAEKPFKFLWQLHKHKGRILQAELINGEKLEGKITEIFENGKDYIIIDISKKGKGKTAVEDLRKINFSDIKESKIKLSFSK